MKETIAGIIAAVLIIMLTRLLSKYVQLKLMVATCLVAIGFIYVGFSLKDNPTSSIIVESVIAMGFYFLAIFGYTRNNRWLSYGIMLHGLWDIFHHNGLLIGTDVPVFWPSFCFVIDIIDGIYFLIVFKRQDSKRNIPSILQTNTPVFINE